MKRLPRSFALLVFAIIPLASGHSPDELEGSLEPDNPKKSWAYYGQFSTGDELLTVVLDYDEGFALPMEILVPRQPEWEDHRPVYAVVGPGLPAPSDELRAMLPAEVPDGMGVFFEPNDDEERIEYYEGFTGTDFWTSGSVALVLDEGVHEVWIWSPEQTTGRFTFGFGVEEDHGLDEIFELTFNGQAYEDD
jgi:hypothetical protein